MKAVEKLTPRDLVQILLEQHGVKHVEELRGRAPVSVRTLRRWLHQGWPSGWATTIRVLRGIGMLRSPGDAATDADLFAEELAEVAATLRVLVETEQRQAQLHEDLAERIALLEAHCAKLRAPQRRREAAADRRRAASNG